MMHNEIARSAVCQNRIKITQPLINKMSIDSIGNSYLFTKNNIAIVCHAVFEHIVLTFEQINLVVVYAYILDSFSYLHGHLLSPMIKAHCIHA